MSDTTTEYPTHSEPIATDWSTIGKPHHDPDAYRTQLLAEITEAEKEQTRDQKALEAAREKVATLEGYVAFDEMKVASRTKSLAEWDRLRAKAAK